MDTTRKILMVLAVAQCLAVFVQAEYRPWSDIKGNTIEAEYIRTSDETVVLRKRDGTEIKVPLLSLSEQDRTYAMLQCPPEIEISMDDRLDRETLDYRGGRPGLRHYRQESVTIDVSLNKTSTEWYDAELSLEICLLGWMEQMNRYVIVGKIDSKFRFSNENKGLFTSTYGPFDLRNVTGSIRAGAEYKGYVLAVRDSRNQIIATKASRLEYGRNAEALLQAQQGSVFDENFKLIHAGKNTRQQPGKEEEDA